MAKAALLDVLQQTIGRYVKNLDPESLNVAVWSGKIELNSLELDVESINSLLDKKAEEAPNLAMPFKVLSGRFESFQVDVPWSQITSRPVVLRARGLSVMVEPLDRNAPQLDDDDDAIENETMKQINRAAKQKELRDHQLDSNNNYRLQAYALKKIALAAEEGNTSDGNEGDKTSFATRLGHRIIENIQVEISNVHISLRNEDGSAGVVLESLKIMSTDKAGNKVYVDRTAAPRRNSSFADVDVSFQYKTFQIEGLGIYLDEDEFETARKSLGTVSEELLTTRNASDRGSLSSIRSLTHSYILAPLSFEAILRIVADKKVFADIATYQMKSGLSSLSFLLTRNQMDTARKVAKIMSPSNIGPSPLFPEYRPLVLVKGNAKEWWKYAVRCIGRMSGRRSWVEFLNAYQKKNKYIPLFKRDAHYRECSWVKPLSSHEMDELITIEQDRSISIEGLMAWRNIADGQIDRELIKLKSEEKEIASTSMFSYVFGSSTAKATENEAKQVKEEAAIVLSVEEMRELEGISKFDITEKDLSKDSILYDMEFVLDSLKVDLVAYDLNHIASLDMGKVTIDFNATMDGAFTSSLELYDLEIFDRTTPNSLFPSVLKKMIESVPEANKSSALNLDLSMSSNGDQSLVLKMAEFQLVSSKFMARELQQFFQDTSDKNGRTSSSRMKSNPMLRKSFSGSVDLFYDAKQVESIRQLQLDPETEDDVRANNSPVVKEILSNKFFDVWKKKSKSKASWMLDLDVKAPVVLIPEICNDPQANVLVFDLGNLKINYGKGDPSAQVQNWFDENPRESLIDEAFEVGTIDINHLTFSVQKARLLHSTDPDGKKEPAIIDPIGVIIDFAIEDIGPTFEPRSCFLGVIPTISLKFSPVQGSQMLEVINSWTDIFSDSDDEITPNVSKSSRNLQGRDTGNNLIEQSKFSQSVSPTGLHVPANLKEHDSHSSLEACPMVFCSIFLQRLTIVVIDEGQKQLEAHLVSVYASILQSSDESSIMRLRMGCFWILDWTASIFARRQRLVIHSNLPRSPESFAESNDYDVIQELTSKGVFERHYSGSTELADVSFKTLPRNARSFVTEGIKLHQNSEHCFSSNIQYILDVKFRSFVVHWNPNAIKGINALFVRFMAIATANDDPTDDDGGTLILTPEMSQTPVRSEQTEIVPRKESVESSGQWLIMAKMESLDIILNSARDDLPLFTLTVSGTRLSIVPRSSGQEISLSLGDLRVATPEKAGKTLPFYRTLLGLESGSTGSLLTVKYCVGREAIESLNLVLDDTEIFEAVADVELSPMRFCYVQSQVMTLVNYITDGILGALTAKAAISAAEAAKELANSVSGNYFYCIRATSFEAIVPEAAYREEHMRLKTASLNVDYFMYSNARGSQIRVDLSDLMVKGNHKKELQEAPIRLSIDVKIPSTGVGSADDQAMKVSAEISKAKFVCSKEQYSQIMNTLSKNFSETALFLRDDEWSGQIVTSAKETHSGTQLDVSTQRLYFILDIKEVSLVLYGQDQTDPIVKLTAIETTVSMDMIPDLDKFSIKVLLQNLVCEDCRLVALKRQCRYLIDQSEQIYNSKSTNIFQIGYTQGKIDSNIDLTLGSPQVVLIPDLISEVLLFVSGTENNQNDEDKAAPMLQEQNKLSLKQQVVQINSIDNKKISERSLRSSNSSVTKISAQTGTCRFVLMDLGSQLTIDQETIDNPENPDSRPHQLTETIVLQGIFSGSYSMESDMGSRKMLVADFQFHSESMEIFTVFGIEMKMPLQILEPASASAHGSLKTAGTEDTVIEVRAAALTSIDFSLSIHNAALLMAIIDSIQGSIKYAEEKETTKAFEEPICLTPKEQERIEKLATALERLERDESLTCDETSGSLEDSRVSSSRQLSEIATPSTTKIQIKVTMPQARVTFINDLQGMDEALFRISVTNFVAGGDLLSPKTLFDFHCNTSILADYFDSSINLWSSLLIKPWEMTIKGSRAPSRRFNSHRLNSTFDLESFPCWISFSEQFLVSLASTARMWSIYSATTQGSLDNSSVENKGDDQNHVTTTAARNLNLTTSFPYAISNHSGTAVSFSLKSGSIDARTCPTECTQYFRFDPPKGGGYGGTRVYGQDVEVPKLVEVKVEGSVAVVNMGNELGLSPCAHKIGDKLVLFTRVVKEGKTTVLHLTSQIEVLNRTVIPFDIDFLYNETSSHVGRCRAKNYQNETSTTLSLEDGVVSKKASNFSVPISLLANFHKDWRKYGQAKLILRLTPLTSDVNGITDNAVELSAEVSTIVSLQELRRASHWCIKSKVEVTCRAKEHLACGVHPLTLNVLLTMKLVAGEHVVIDVSLEPRALIENRMPLSMKVRTPMPQTFSTCQKEENGNKEITYCLDPNERIEVFTPGPSIAIATRTRDNPIAGQELGWLDGGWVDLPLQESRLQDPIIGIFPLQMENAGYTGEEKCGAEFFIVAGNDALQTIAAIDAREAKNASQNEPFQSTHLEPKNVSVDDPLSFILTVCNYGVDHTGNILFEQGSSVGIKSSLRQFHRSNREVESQRRRGSGLLAELDPFSEIFNSEKKKSETLIGRSPPNPLGAFSSPLHRRRISLLPNAQCPIRLLQMTMEWAEGFKRTMPFMIEHLPIGDGGAATVPIVWENKDPTGLFVYRYLVNEYQSEIHIIPEFIVFNGSKNVVLVKEETMPEVIIESGDIGQLRTRARPNGLELSFQFIEFECHTAPLPVWKLGLKVAIVKSNDGVAVGSVYIQTVIDTRGDSRLVVKVGEVKFGSRSSPVSREKGLFDGDFCRFRVRWTELQLILNEAGQKRESWNLKARRGPQKNAPTFNADKSRTNETHQKLSKRASAMNIFKQDPQNCSEEKKTKIVKQPIMAMIFSRFTVDFQRVFKDEEKSRRNLSDTPSPQRSQISIIVHNVQIKDLTPNSHYPIVFDCTSDISVFDLCIRIRGPLSADLVKVDLFDLNLAHENGNSEKMTLTTSEDYLWRILDLVNRILAASGDVSGFTLKYEDADLDGYVIKIEDSGKPRSQAYEKNQYTPPTADTLYDIALARVSPFTVVVSFRRSPEQSRYTKVNDAPGAAVTNYFTRKLKFTIDKAELNFTRYEDRSLKGPSDSLIETLSTVYVSRMKFKVVSLLSAASLQDWRYLAARDDGDDDYVEGDILRATGNLAGKSAGLVLNTFGRGVGGGFIRASSFVGEGIENGTNKIGARRFGSGVSSVVTGMGHGVGDTVSGVGTGASKFFQGAGQGVGHVFGGVSGGALQIGKGIGKGIATGDGRAVVEGITKGASSVGGGIAQGAESAVVGTADGLLSAGKGIFSGFKNIGQGIGGAITGKKPSHFQRKIKDNDRKSEIR